MQEVLQRPLAGIGKDRSVTVNTLLLTQMRVVVFFLSFLSVETLLLRVLAAVLVTLDFEPDVLSDPLELLHGLPDPCTSSTVTIVVLLSIDMGVF